MNFFTKFSLHSNDNKKRRRNDLIIIGFTVQDIDYLLKLLDTEKQEAAEVLHAYAMQGNQQEQGKAVGRFKDASNMYEYLRDRLEQKLSMSSGSYGDNEDVL
jgi:hypothetical protein